MPMDIDLIHRKLDSLDRCIHRVDPQDRSDIQFLLQQVSLDPEPLEKLLNSACIPEIPEIRDAFQQNGTRLRHLVR